MIKIEITDSNVVDAFNRLIALGENPRGALMGIAEEALLPFVRDRFSSSTDPYGVPWEPLKTRQGKPLIGESGSLSTQFHYDVDDTSVTLTSLMGYAALQNFGGTVKPKNANALFFMVGDRKVFAKSVTIPARPFFPNAEQGLPDELNRDISDVLRAALENALKG